MRMRPCRTAGTKPGCRPTRRDLLRWSAGLTCLMGAPSLAACGEPIEPAPAAPVAAFAGNGAPPLLVDAAWLRDRLAAGSPADRPRIVDLSPLRTYRAGHVPGAVHGWWQDTLDPHDDVYGVVLGATPAATELRPEPATHAEILRELGIGDGDTAVFYDADRNRYAARLVWYLRYLGQPAAAILDGGLAAWRGTGNAVETDERDVSLPVRPAPIQLRDELIVSTHELAERLHDPSLAILDARTAGEADDDLNNALPLGQILGSIRIPWTASLRDDVGRLKSPDDLRVLFAAAGIGPEREVAVVARFGVETGQPWLVLTLLGYPRLRVYDRGWAGWAATPGLPVAPLGPIATG